MTSTSAPHAAHGVEELCATGAELCERALREGSLPADEARAAPCLVDLGLLRPALDDVAGLEPDAPLVVPHRCPRASGERIAEARRREEEVAAEFQALARIGTSTATATEPPTLQILSGTARVNQAITEAMARSTEEVLTIQPRAGLTGPRGDHADAVACERDQEVPDRGVRVRTLYQETVRHFPSVISRQGMRGDLEVRSLNEVPGRLIVIDRSVAFIPADEDGSLAAEIRNPAIVDYLATAFERFWRLAEPMLPKRAPQAGPHGLTPRQRAAAELLVEGRTDSGIAERPGLDVRTCRAHIAKLAAALGSRSRARLGCLIGQSGILEQEGHHT
ncbi:helix-turn-helix transcriptional regulator [Streptomyces sp. SBST2-5]|uniref:Helix-turn-helix transcriptional regulator n=1 Tax=Streptomyces composti TaxID=2720025 RepID=A0ABX1A6Z6_9ACTN|nr:helix-turn-helix transcriptional regulator [Streptomyces composti]